MLLPVLAHVDADHGPLVVEQERGERLGQLGLADAGGPEEQERPGGTVLLRDPGPRAADGVGHGPHGLGLPDHAAAELVLHAQELRGLALEQAPGGDAGPRRHDVRDVVGADLLLEHHRGRRAGVGRGELLLQGGDAPVAQLRGPAQVTVALGALGLPAQGLELLLERARRVDRVLLALPAGGQRVELLAALGELGPQGGEALRGRGVGLLGQRHLLDLEAAHGALDLVDLHRPRVDLHAQPRAGLVDEVDGLVGQEARGDVAVGERGRGHQRGVGDPHAVVDLVALLEPAQDADGVVDGGLADQDLLEAALERRVGLDVLAVLVERRRADHAQLAARQHRLDHVAGVHGGLAGRAGADDRVQLVDEGDDLARGVGDLLQDGLEPLLELAAVLGPGHHRAHVQGDDALVAQRLGHVTGDDPLRQALDDRRLADAGLADEHRVVLGAPGEDLDDAADLRVAAHDGVEGAGAGALGEVLAVLLQGLEGALGVGGRDPPRPAHLRERLLERLGRRAVAGEHLAGAPAGRGQPDQQVLGGDVLVAHVGGELSGRAGARARSRGRTAAPRRSSRSRSAGPRGPCRRRPAPPTGPPRPRAAAVR